MPDLEGIDHWVTPVMPLRAAARSGSRTNRSPWSFASTDWRTVPVSVALAGTSGTRAAAATPERALAPPAPTTRSPRIDASTGQPQPPVDLDAPATDIAIGPASLWLLDDGIARTVREVDPDSGRTIGTVEVGGLPGDAVFAGGSLWVTVHAP